jgi:hypothetical protein
MTERAKGTYSNRKDVLGHPKMTETKTLKKVKSSNAYCTENIKHNWPLAR